jgi:hypothetical protein
MPTTNSLALPETWKVIKECFPGLIYSQLRQAIHSQCKRVRKYPDEFPLGILPLFDDIKDIDKEKIVKINKALCDEILSR